MTLFEDPYEQFLLDYLVTKLENGSNTRRALILYSEQISRETKFKKRLLAAIKDMEIGKQNLEAILFKHKFLNPKTNTINNKISASIKTLPFQNLHVLQLI